MNTQPADLRLLGQRVRVLDSNKQPTSVEGVAYRLRHIAGRRMFVIATPSGDVEVPADHVTAA